MTSTIHIENLTKDYGNNRGIFDINLDIPKGMTFGYVGTNGSGKTTTIRHLMGFIKPNQGKTTINGLDTWTNATELMKHVSYVPGEIAFPSLASGTEFLKLQAEYLGIKDFTYMNELIAKLQLDPSANLKRMSKGMKQKTAIVAALMADKDILILDEPTTGLDPLMREAFLEILREEKAKGKTIFMSSHIFEEIENICDQVAMIKDGHIIDTIDLWNLRHWETKTFDITFSSPSDYQKFTKQWQNFQNLDEKLSIQVTFPVEKIQQFFKVLKTCSIKNLKEQHITLNQYFNTVYLKGVHHE